MDKKFLICISGGSGKVVEKKSEFIGELIPVNNEASAQQYIESRRKEYWDARHHCYAYIIGDTKKFSDDGEPSQTAGKPMMDILENACLTNVCLVVTRYFGGTLLGTGGLVRAYQAAAKTAIENAVLSERIDGVRLDYIISYDLYGTLQRMNLNLIDAKFGESVTISIVVPKSDKDRVIERITEASNAKAVLLNTENIFYTEIGGRTEIL